MTADRRCGAETLITAERTPAGTRTHVGEFDATRQEFLFSDCAPRHPVESVLPPSACFTGGEKSGTSLALSPTRDHAGIGFTEYVGAKARVNMLNKSHAITDGHAGEEGTSLVEIVIVGMIIAVVTAIALPAVANSIRSYNLRSAANHLAERMSAVRALAMAKNRNVTFSFNNNTGRYGFDFDLPPDGIPDTSDPVDRTLGGYYWETLPQGVTTTFPDGNPIMIDFNSRGELPIGALARSIVLQSYGRSATVSVNLRGKISVQ